MPGKRKAPWLTVPDILNKCQETAGGHSKYARMLWEVEAGNSDACFKELIRCLTYLLTVPPSTNTNVERALRFVATFAAQAPDREDDTSSVFIQDLVADLVLLSAAANKVVRVRACGLLASIMQQLTTDMQDEALDELQEAMLKRLKDKVPQVRMNAAMVLERLAEPGEDSRFMNDPITKGYRKLLAVERNKDVRKCILGVMPIVAETTVQDLLERTSDVSDAVRKQAFSVLANKCRMGNLSKPQRALVLRQGLRDRSPGVLEAARTLAQTWLLEDCQADVLKLLHELDVEAFAEEAEEALKALAAAGNLQLSEIASDAKTNCSGLRSPQGYALLSSEEAFFWRWVCVWLHAQGSSKGQAAAAARGAEAEVEAAAASDSLQALEAALPKSVAGLMDIVAAHAAAGSERGYAVTQLLCIAAQCVDLTDASGRKAAAKLVQDLLRQPGWTENRGGTWEQAILQLAKQVYSQPAELEAWLMDAVTATQEMRLNDRGSGHDWCQALSLTSLLLQQLRSSGQQMLSQILNGIIYPGIAQGLPHVRAAAFRCLGLFSLVSMLGFRVSCEPAMEQCLPVSLLRAGLADPKHAVRLEAAKGLCDLAAARGPKAVDACHTHMIAHPSEYLPATQDAAAVTAAARQAAADARPLLDLLGHRLSGLAASGRGQEAMAAAEEQRELGSVVAEGLAKLVMHQSRWRADSQGRMEDSEISQVLVRLLVAYVDHATEAAAAARQCLSVFFPAYTAFCGWHQRLLCEATLPAARRALGLGPSPAKSVAPSLLRFVLQLLQSQASVPAEEGAREGGHSSLAIRCLAEVLACPKTPAAKPYLAALVRLAAGLPLKNASPEAVKALRLLTDQVKATLGGGAAARDAAGLCRRLAALDNTPSEALSEEAVAEMLQQAQRSGAGSELPFQAAAMSRTPARPRAAARKPAIIDADTSNESEEEEGEEAEAESGDENAPQPQELTRATGKVSRGRKGTRPQALTSTLQENLMSPTL